MRKFLAFFLFIIHTMSVFAGENTCADTPNSHGCRAGLPEDEYTFLLEEMQKYPEPDVKPPDPNMDEIYRYAYWRLDAPNGVTIFNAPGGTPVKSLAPGYHYISAYSYQEGWIEINPGQG